MAFARNLAAIASEVTLGRVPIIRISLSAVRMDAPDRVRNYKAVGSVERAFRSLKAVNPNVRPIHYSMQPLPCSQRMTEPHF